MKDLYDITKKLAGKRSKQERPVKDKAGKQLEGDEEQRRRWKEHFEELLNRPVPHNPPNITPAGVNNLAPGTPPARMAARWGLPPDPGCPYVSIPRRGSGTSATPSTAR